MKVILIIILIIAGIFVALFLAGMVSAAILGSKKKRRAFALVAIAQLPEELRSKLLTIFLSYQKEDVKRVNSLVQEMDREYLKLLLNITSPQNRPADFSAGRFGDNLSWTAMEISLTEKGYSANASKIIAGIFLHDFNEVLSKMEQSK